MRRRLAALLVAVVLAGGGLATGPATAAGAATIPRWQAFVWALHHRGDWYCWGGTGPACFDCSGLVYAAYRAERVPYFGRTTYEMLASGHLRRVPWSRARWGMLVFWGNFHVELYAGPRQTLGAEHSGTRVGFHTWGSFNVPSGVYEVQGAG